MSIVGESVCGPSTSLSTSPSDAVVVPKCFPPKYYINFRSLWRSDCFFVQIKVLCCRYPLSLPTSTKHRNGAAFPLFKPTSLTLFAFHSQPYFIQALSVVQHRIVCIFACGQPDIWFCPAFGRCCPCTPFHPFYILLNNKTEIFI